MPELICEFPPLYRTQDAVCVNSSHDRERMASKKKKKARPFHPEWALIHRKGFTASRWRTTICLPGTRVPRSPALSHRVTPALSVRPSVTAHAGALPGTQVPALGAFPSVEEESQHTNRLTNKQGHVSHSQDEVA